MGGPINKISTFLQNNLISMEDAASQGIVSSLITFKFEPFL